MKVERLSENHFCFAFVEISFTTVLRAFLLSPIFFVLFKMYTKRKNLQNKLKDLPTCKLRFYSFLGHMGPLKSHYFHKYPAPFHVYHSMLMNAFSKVYGKDGLCMVWQVSKPVVLVYEAEAVEMILSHSTEIKKAWFYRFLHPWLGEGLLTSHGSKWKQRRKLLTPAFHFNILKVFLPVFNKQSRILTSVLQGHAESEYVNIVPLISKCTFDIICETILGEEMHSQTRENCEYLKAVVGITDVVTERVLRPWLWQDILFALSPSSKEQTLHLGKLRTFANELISRKKKEKLGLKFLGLEEIEEESKGEDIYHSRKRKALLDLLLEEHLMNGSISEQEIREEVDTFTFEGHDTTAMAMSWSLYLIGLHPEVQAKIHDEFDSIFGEDDRDPTIEDLREMKYLECVVKETLRLYPSVPGYGRELQQDIEFKGHLIPKECTCFVWAYLLHRDQNVFPNPEKFDPERFSPENSSGRHPFAYVPFSAGPRNCIGQKYALMELKSVLSSILRKFKIRSLDARDQVHDMFEVVLRPHGELKLEFRKRQT